MKRLIYIVVACILFSIILHAQRIPRWFEVKPNYFATAIIYDVDSITFDKFYGDEWTKGYIALRSPAIAKKGHHLDSFRLSILFRHNKTRFLYRTPLPNGL